MSGRGEHGGVTAEFAVVLPAVLVVVGLVASLGSAQATRVLLQDAVADAARLAGRAESSARVVGAVTATVPGAGVAQHTDGDVVCVTGTTTAHVLGVVPVPLTARACALAGGR